MVAKINNPHLFPDISRDVKSKVNPKLILALDVATHYTGYAFFEVSGIDRNTCIIGDYGNFKATESTPDLRILQMTAKISNIIHTVKPGILVQEFPSFQAGVKGVQASRAGDTLTLAYLCGRISTCWEMYITKVLRDTGVQFQLPHNITYREWNGQLPKHATCRRCKEAFEIDLNYKTIENNCADAIMLGKWFIENRLNMKVGKNKDVERVDL